MKKTYKDDDSFEQLILLICNKSPDIGTVKLNKLLWLLDKEAYCLMGKSLTGISYLRKQYGPVPFDGGKILNRMESKGLLRVKEVTLANGETTQRKFRAKRKPKRDFFTHDQKELIHSVLEKYANMHTNELVALSHDLVWASFCDDEEIPLVAYVIANQNGAHDLHGYTSAMIQKAEETYAKTFAN